MPEPGKKPKQSFHPEWPETGPAPLWLRTAAQEALGNPTKPVPNELIEGAVADENAREIFRDLTSSRKLRSESELIDHFSRDKRWRRLLLELLESDEEGRAWLEKLSEFLKATNDSLDKFKELLDKLSELLKPEKTGGIPGNTSTASFIATTIVACAAIATVAGYSIGERFRLHVDIDTKNSPSSIPLTIQPNITPIFHLDEIQKQLKTPIQITLTPQIGDPNPTLTKDVTVPVHLEFDPEDGNQNTQGGGQPAVPIQIQTTCDCCGSKMSDCTCKPQCEDSSSSLSTTVTSKKSKELTLLHFGSASSECVVTITAENILNDSATVNIVANEGAPDKQDCANQSPLLKSTPLKMGQSLPLGDSNWTVTLEDIQLPGTAERLLLEKPTVSLRFTRCDKQSSSRPVQPTQSTVPNDLAIH